MYAKLKRLVLSRTPRDYLLGSALLAPLLVVFGIAYWESQSVPSSHSALHFCSAFVVNPVVDLGFQGHYFSSDTKAFIFSYASDPSRVPDDDYETQIIESATAGGWVFVERNNGVLLFHQLDDAGVPWCAVKVAVIGNQNRVLVGWGHDPAMDFPWWEKHRVWPRYKEELKEMKKAKAI